MLDSHEEEQVERLFKSIIPLRSSTDGYGRECRSSSVFNHNGCLHPFHESFKYIHDGSLAHCFEWHLSNLIGIQRES